MIKRGVITAFISLLTVGLLLPETNAGAAAVSLDTLAENAMYHTEQKLVGYQDIEKNGFKDKEITGYKEVEVPVYDFVISEFLGKTGDGFYQFSNEYTNRLYDQQSYLNAKQYGEIKIIPKQKEITKYKTVPYQEKQSYTVKEPIYKTVYSYTAKQKTQAYTKTSTKYKLSATNPYGKKYYVSMSKFTKLTRVNKDWYKATISYDHYKKVERTYNHQRINTSTKYYNSKGQKVTLSVPKNTTLTKKSGSYYATVKYTPYQKIRGKWVKQKQISKKVYVNRKYISGSMTWEPGRKKAMAYIPSKYVATKASRVKSGEKSITKYRSINKTKQEAYTTKENYNEYLINEQVGTKLENQPFTYIEKEPYTYTVQEPIYEDIKVENPTSQKYQTIINYYWRYSLTEEELYRLLDQVQVPYQVVYGYDQSRSVSGFMTVNGTSTYYQFTPNTRVKLIIFEDHNAINLSYLLKVYGNSYNDVKIGIGGYLVD
ncbi:hypothetical protein [Bacillus massilinigeriensis]|uniref:hypothetical protein n=1 Tax=Bacillus massilionigeriensis TaxID=1805475 RepID=UPI00096B6513|nr:hypothetical protein [Bacillus massilionigeriensis]